MHCFRYTWGLPNQIISVVSSVCSPISERHIPYSLDTGPDCLNMSDVCGFVTIAYSFRSPSPFNVQKKIKQPTPASEDPIFLMEFTDDRTWWLEHASFDLRSFNLGMGWYGSIFVRLPTHKYHVDLFARCAIGQEEEGGHGVPNTSAVQAAGVSGDVWSVGPRLLRTQVASHVTFSWLLNYENCNFLPSGYVKIAIEHGHRNSWFTQKKDGDLS